MIDQIAACSNITQMQLIQHSRDINQVLREKSRDSKNLSALSREIKQVALDLMEATKVQKQQGARVIVCEDEDGLQLDVNRVIKMLKESSNTLGHMANKFDKHARGYDYQVQVNDHTMNTFQSLFSLQTRVITCERQSNARLMKQKSSLQRALPKIEEHEQTIEGFKSAIGLPRNNMRLLQASTEMLESI
jgi:hypothetical protein